MTTTGIQGVIQATSNNIMQSKPVQNAENKTQQKTVNKKSMTKKHKWKGRSKDKFKRTRMNMVRKARLVATDGPKDNGFKKQCSSLQLIIVLVILKML